MEFKMWYIFDINYDKSKKFLEENEIPYEEWDNGEYQELRIDLLSLNKSKKFKLVDFFNLSCNIDNYNYLVLTY